MSERLIDELKQIDTKVCLECRFYSAEDDEEPCVTCMKESPSHSKWEPRVKNAEDSVADYDKDQEDDEELDDEVDWNKPPEGSTLDYLDRTDKYLEAMLKQAKEGEAKGECHLFTSGYIRDMIKSLEGVRHNPHALGVLIGFVQEDKEKGMKKNEV